MPHQDTRFLLLEGVHQNAVTTLKQAGFARVELLPGTLEGDALADALQRADVVGIRSRTQLSDAVLQTAPHLQAIGCFCIGTNLYAVYRGCRPVVVFHCQQITCQFAVIKFCLRFYRNFFLCSFRRTTSFAQFCRQRCFPVDKIPFNIPIAVCRIQHIGIRR